MKSIFVLMRSEGDSENPLTAFSIAKAIIENIDLAMLSFPRIEVKDSIFTNRTTYTKPYIYGKTVDDVVDIDAIHQLSLNYKNKIELTYNLNIPKFRDNFIKQLYKEAERIATYDIAFFSVFRYHLLYHLLLSTIVKTINKSIKIVFGGPQIILSRLTRNIIEESCNFVDTILIGNIEDCLPIYLEYYNNSPKVMMIQHKNNINNLIPEYKPFTKIFNNTINLFSSRNCSMTCSYCPNGSNDLKYQKVDLKVVDTWLDYYSSNRIYFTDPYINLINKRFNNLLDIMMSTNFKHKYTMWLDSKKLTFQHIEKLCKLKPKRVWVAYDIVNREFSIKMGRLHDIDIDEKIKTLTNCNINTVVPFIIGLPGETNEIFNETVKKIEDLKGFCNNNLQVESFPYLHNVGSRLFYSDPLYKNGISENIMEDRLSKVKSILNN